MTQFKSLIAESIFKCVYETTASQQMAEIKMIKRDPIPQFNKKINEDQYKPTKQLQKPWKTPRLPCRRKISRRQRKFWIEIWPFLRAIVSVCLENSARITNIMT